MIDTPESLLVGEKMKKPPNLLIGIKVVFSLKDVEAREEIDSPDSLQLGL